MSRLIDADALMVWLVNMLNEFDDGNDPHEIKREMFQVVLAKTRKMPTVDRWISVNDRLPETAGEYIVSYHPCHWDYVDRGKTLVGIDNFRGKTTWAKHKYQRVTHWMLLPEPPKEDSDAE